MTIDRRTLLRGAGVAVALPWMESLALANERSSQEPLPPRRMVLICLSLGLHGPNFFPQETGVDYTPSNYLKLIDRHRQHYSVFSGLSHPDQAGVDGHASQFTWLSSAPNPGLGGFRNTISVDQFARQHLGYATRFPTLTLSTESSGSQSYTAGGVMVPAEYRPSVLYEQMFLQGRPEEVAAQRHSLSQGRSILDLLSHQTKRVQQRASPSDRQKLDEYLQSLREAEKEFQLAQQWTDRPKPTVPVPKPTDVQEVNDIVARTRLMFKLMPLIVQTDSSRIITMLIQGRSDVPPIDGVKLDHHNLSHHGQDEQKLAQLHLIEAELMKCFGELLDGLRDKSELDRSLLDSTAVLLGSNLGNANSHDVTNLPILLAGGEFSHGGHMAFDTKKNRPLCSLFLDLLHHIGVPADRFGSSDGRLLG